MGMLRGPLPLVGISLGMLLVAALLVIFCGAVIRT
jgi:hypothetical protein